MVLIPGLGRCAGGGNGNPLLYSCLENPTDRGAWPTTVHGVTKSRTQLSMQILTHTHTYSQTSSPDFSGAFETVCQPCISQLCASQPSQTEQIPVWSFPLECLLSQKGTTILSSMLFLGASDRKESVCNAGDLS